MKNFNKRARRANAHVPLLLAFGGLLSLLFYGALALVHQHLYGALHIHPHEVGLDRGRLVIETFGALLALALILAVVFALPFAPAIWAVGARWRRWSFRGLAVLIALSPWAFMWFEAGRAAGTVRDGSQYSGIFGWGLYLLDFESTPFHFTKLPAGHDFDRACVLYLGRDDGQLVMYDVKGDEPLRLPESDYQGEARGWASRALPQRCFEADPDGKPLVSGDEIGDVDAGGDAVVWTSRPVRTRRWWLVARVAGTDRVLSRSAQDPAPDLGRAADGRLVLTYRACSAATCRLRQRDLHGDGSALLASPRRDGCGVAGGARSATLIAVVLTGARCRVADRGVWVRPTGARWRRVRSSGLATSEIDVLGPRVAWVERRGPIERIRALADGPPWTVAQVPVAGRGVRAVGGLRVVARGLVWAQQPGPSDEARIMSYNWASRTCARHATVPVGPHDGARFAPWRGGTVTATGTSVRRVDGRLDLAETASQRCDG